MATTQNATTLFLNAQFASTVEDNDMIILKNKDSNKLIRLSKPEYMLIEQYSSCQSISETFDMANALHTNISFEHVIALIEKAKELKLLVSPAEMQAFENKYRRKDKGHSILALYFLQLVKSMAGFTGLGKKRIRTEFAGNFTFYKLFSINISNTLISHFFTHKASRILLFIVGALFCFSIAQVAKAQSLNIFGGHSLAGIKMAQVSLNKYLIFFILIIGMIVTSVFHEFAHYFVYKQLKGKTDEFGFALINFCIPVVYVSTNSVYLWSGKWKKILVSSAGICLDLLMIFGLYAMLAAQSLKATPNLTFMCFLMMMYLIFRTLININFMIPGTDGYFIFVDVFNLKNFYQSTFQSTRSVFSSIVRLKFKQIRLKSIIHTFYYLISLVLFVVISLLLIVSLLYPLISDLLIGLFI